MAHQPKKQIIGTFRILKTKDGFSRFRCIHCEKIITEDLYKIEKFIVKCDCNGAKLHEIKRLDSIEKGRLSLEKHRQAKQSKIFLEKYVEKERIKEQIRKFCDPNYLPDDCFDRYL